MRDAIVSLLNDALKTDPDSINALFRLHVRCGDALQNHPTIVCGGREDDPHIGILGLINGLFTGGLGSRITIIYDDQSLRIVKFANCED